MAKKSSIEKNKRRTLLTAKFRVKRAALKAVANDEQRPQEERFAARLKLAKLPRRADSPAPLAPRLIRGTAIAAITPMMTTTITNSTRLNARFLDRTVMIAYSLEFLVRCPTPLGRCMALNHTQHTI